MGFNTTIMILNDRLDEISRDPEFGRKLVQNILAHSSRDPNRLPNYMPAVEIVSVEHADTISVVAVGGNTGRVLGYGFWRQTPINILKDVLKALKLKEKQNAE